MANQKLSKFGIIENALVMKYLLENVKDFWKYVNPNTVNQVVSTYQYAVDNKKIPAWNGTQALSDSVARFIDASSDAWKIKARLVLIALGKLVKSGAIKASIVYPVAAEVENVRKRESNPFGEINPFDPDSAVRKGASELNPLNPESELSKAALVAKEALEKEAKKKIVIVGAVAGTIALLYVGGLVTANRAMHRIKTY